MINFWYLPLLPAIKRALLQSSSRDIDMFYNQPIKSKIPPIYVKYIWIEVKFIFYVGFFLGLRLGYGWGGAMGLGFFI